MMLTFCEYDTLTSSKKIVDDMWYCKKFMENGMKRFYFGIKIVKLIHVEVFIKFMEIHIS